jgi:uncharacterized protein
MKPFFILLLLTAGLLAETPALKLVEAARKQVGVTTRYDPAYVTLAFPNGDVPMDRGVCTDVVIRAFRSGLSQDLQKLMNEDMRGNFSAYPRQWGLSKPDKNIDHRRVPNLQTYFKRKGWSLSVTKSAADYLPGDIVTCTVPPSLPHVMIVSDKMGTGETRLVLHNIGGGAREEEGLFTYPLTGHYRVR